MLKIPKVIILLYLGKKEVRDKFIFCMKISIKVSLKQIPSFLLTIARHAKSTQSSKLAVSFQYLKTERRHEVDFLHANKQTFLYVDAINTRRKYSKDEVGFCTDKHQSIQKPGTIVTDGCSQASPKYSK